MSRILYTQSFGKTEKNGGENVFWWIPSSRVVDRGHGWVGKGTVTEVPEGHGAGGPREKGIGGGGEVSGGGKEVWGI